MTSRRTDSLITLLLFLASTSMRIPFRSVHLFHGDSYALAAGVLFTLTAHPPGFIGYCFLARLAYLLVGDVNLAFVVINVLATGVATSLTYLFARQMFDRSAGVIAAVIYATSIDTSYFSEVALTYAAEGMFATGVALTGWLALKRRSFAWLALNTALLGIGGSVRQTTLAFLIPLWIWLAWRTTPRWRERALAVVILAAVVWSWSVPNAQRLAKYWDKRDVSYFESVYNLQVAMVQYYDSTSFGAVDYEPHVARFHWPLVELGVAIWNRFDPPAADARPEVRSASAANALRMMVYQTAKLLFYGTLAMGLGTAFLLLALRRRVRSSIDVDRWVFLGLWIVPAAAFFALNHLGAWGYLLIFLAGLATIAARAVTVLFDTTRGRLIAASTISLVNLAFFLVVRPLPDTTERNRVLNVAVLQYSAPAIHMHYARARSSAFTSDPRQLTLRCYSDACLKQSIPVDFDLPRDLEPVTPLANR